MKSIEISILDLVYIDIPHRKKLVEVRMKEAGLDPKKHFIESLSVERLSIIISQ